MSRAHDGQRITVVPTDHSLARSVGSLLHSCGLGSEALADAHVVVAAAQLGTAVVSTTDADDIARMAAYLPGSTILTRNPRDH